MWRGLVLFVGLMLTCCGGTQAIRSTATVGDGSGVSATPPPSAVATAAPATTTPSIPSTTPSPETPSPTASAPTLTPQPSPTPLPSETYSFDDTGSDRGTATYSGGGFIARLYATASWSFHCYVNAPLTDPFGIELPDGQHLSGYGFGGYGSTNFVTADSNVDFAVTDISRVPLDAYRHHDTGLGTAVALGFPAWARKCDL